MKNPANTNIFELGGAHEVRKMKNTILARLDHVAKLAQHIFEWYGLMSQVFHAFQLLVIELHDRCGVGASARAAR